MLGRPLKVSQMDTRMLYDDVAWLPQRPGLPVGNEEGQRIAAALGTRRAVLLAHHGIVIAGRSIEEACIFAIQCERAARLQLLAEAAGHIIDVDLHLAREAHDWILQESRSRASFYYFVRRMLRSFTARQRRSFGEFDISADI